MVIAGNGWGKEDASPTATGQVQQQPVGEAQGAPEDENKPKKGSNAPAFSLAMLDSDTVYQVGGKRDKALLLNFWASWCGPCDLEAPDLVALYNKYKDKMDLYAVNATNYDKVRNAREFVQEKGFEFPVLMDEKGEAVNLYRVYALPTSFIIDRDGKIVERIEGIIPLEKWEELLANVVNY
jgi:thiol-disulfide isomerase/thioredoxin